MHSRFAGWLVGTFLAWVTLGVIVLGLLWAPVVGPWAQQRKGMANFNQAEIERKILVELARAERDAASLRAEAIQIVGAAAQQFPEYRKQEYIGAFADALREGKIEQLIYIPTEANIPILEASRLAD